MNVRWQKNMQLIDANVILRSILNDIPEMAERAIIVMQNGAYTKPEVIAEVVYVLKKVYSMPKEKIAHIIHELSRLITIIENECVLYATDLYLEVSLDFVDCLLVAYHVIDGERIFTFDKKLNKYLAIKGTDIQKEEKFDNEQ